MPRRFQFSLRGVLVVVALVCCALVALPYWFRVLDGREVKELRQEISESDDRLHEMGKNLQQHEPTLDESAEYLTEAWTNGEMKKRLRKIDPNE